MTRLKLAKGSRYWMEDDNDDWYVRKEGFKAPSYYNSNAMPYSVDYTLLVQFHPTRQGWCQCHNYILYSFCTLFDGQHFLSLCVILCVMSLCVILCVMPNFWTICICYMSYVICCLCIYWTVSSTVFKSSYFLIHGISSERWKEMWFSNISSDALIALIVFFRCLKHL